MAREIYNLECGDTVMCIDTDDEIPDDTWCWTKGRPVNGRLCCPNHLTAQRVTNAR